jgi:CRISPR system Cascade subunit CasE
MILTQILVPYELAVRQLRIRDSYDWHQRVWQAFKGRSGEKRDFLTRLDEIDETYRLLVVSPTPPEKPDWCPTDCYQSKAIPEDFFSHSSYRFSLLANATKKRVVVDEAGKVRTTGKRVALTAREDLIRWMERKAAAGGFDIGDSKDLRIIPKPRSYFERQGRQGVHGAVEFQGVLTITDEALFRQTFTTGIGSAKAFGFGLLAVAPLP